MEREDVVEARRAVAPDPFLTERRVAQRLSKGVATLIEDLLAMCHEQKAVSRQPGAELCVINRCNDRLARTGCRHEQVAVVSMVTRQA